jgi:hypothetical protein
MVVFLIKLDLVLEVQFSCRWQLLRRLLGLLHQNLRLLGLLLNQNYWKHRILLTQPG